MTLWRRVVNSRYTLAVTTPVDQFMADVAADLEGVNVRRLAADGYKDAECRDFLDRAGLNWRADFRRVGAGKDGSRDVRALQRLVLNRRLKLPDSSGVGDGRHQERDTARWQRESGPRQSGQPRAD